MHSMQRITKTANNKVKIADRKRFLIWILSVCLWYKQLVAIALTCFACKATCCYCVLMRSKHSTSNPYLRSASLATSCLSKNHKTRAHLFSLSLNQFYFFLNETNTLSFVNLWRPYHSNFSTYLSDLILVYTKQTEKSGFQNENAN